MRNQTRYLQQFFAPDLKVDQGTNGPGVTDLVTVSTPARLYNFVLINRSGAAGTFNILDGSTVMIRLGTVANSSSKAIELAPGFLTFNTEIRIQTSITGFAWEHSIFYTDAP